MTRQQILAMVDTEKPNAVPPQDKERWLCEIEEQVRSVVKGYEEPQQEEELLLQGRYSAVYRFWIEAQIDWYNAEIGKYNNAMALFNTVWQDWMNAYNREHMPNGTQSLRF